MTDGKGKRARKWSDEAEEALARTGEALRAAWEGSREARLSALEAAKQAASRMAEAIDRGVAEAKEAWEGNRDAGEVAEEE